MPSPDANYSTVQIGTYTAQTDAFTSVLDLNDRSTYYVRPGGAEWHPPDVTDVDAGNIRTPGVDVVRSQYGVGYFDLSINIRGSTTTAIITAYRNLISAIDKPPYVIRYALPGSTNFSYIDVIGRKYSKWNTNAIQVKNGASLEVSISFKCRPFLRGDRVFLQNLINNPGCEAPSGTGVTAFTDTFTNTNAYTLSNASYRQEVVADKPLRYYRLGESSGTTATDAMASGNNGTYTASPTLAQSGAISGDSDTAVLFASGSSQYVTANATSLPTGAASWTIACWLKVAGSPGSTQTVMSFGLNSTSHGAPQFTIDSSRRIQLSDATTSTAVSAAISTGVFHHLVGTYDGSTLKFFLDGVAGATAAATVAIPGSGTFTTIGATALASPSQFLSGTVDEVVIYDSVLSATRITTLYQIGTATFSGGSLTTDKAYYAETVRADTPLRYYRLDEASGTTAYDAQVTGNNGTYTNSPTLGVTGALTGDSDTGITLNGTNQYVSISTTGLPTGSTNVMIECWAKWAAAPGAQQYIMQIGDGTAGNKSINIVLDTTGKVFVGNNVVATALSSVLSTGAYHHLVGAWNASTGKVQGWVDGTQLTDSSATTDVFSYGACTVGCRTDAAANFFGGQVDEVAIYTTLLSNTRISAHYTAGTTTPASASNTMLIPAEGRVTFGSPNWSSINTWQARFRYTTSGTVLWHYHYTDANNYLAAVVSGTRLALIHTVSGVTTTLTSATIQLVPGIFYWLKATQFPMAGGPANNADKPMVAVTIYVDSGSGTVGTQVASATLSIAAGSTSTALQGKPAIESTGATLGMGGNYSSVHAVTLFGPGGWYFSGSGGTGLCSGAWYQEGPSANTFSNGKTYSYASARVDCAPAGTVSCSWSNADVTSSTTLGATAIGVSSSQLLYIQGAIYTSGMGANATTKLALVEYDGTGSLLRTTNLVTITGNNSNIQMYGPYTITTGASCSYGVVQVQVADTNAGASANGIVYLDNFQAWNSTFTGATTMPYCALRFPQSPAQLEITGIVGDVPAPAAVFMGTYFTSWAANSTMTYILGKRSEVAAASLLVGSAHAPTNGSGFWSYALDTTSYGGFYVTGTVSTSGRIPLAFNSTVTDLRGTYHLFNRFKTSQSGGNLANVSVKTNTMHTQNTWFSTSYQQVYAQAFGTVIAAPLAAGSTWYVIDTGQVAMPVNLTAYEEGGATSEYQPHPEWSDSTGGGSTGFENYQALVPVDGGLLMSLTNNPSNSSLTVTNNYFWILSDGLSTQIGNPSKAVWVNSAGSTGNTIRQYNMGGLPGTSSSYNINTNQLADNYLTLDPTQTVSGSTLNQATALVTDNNNAVLPCYVDIVYTPLYLYPR